MKFFTVCSFKVLEIRVCVFGEFSYPEGIFTNTNTGKNKIFEKRGNDTLIVPVYVPIKVQRVKLPYSSVTQFYVRRYRHDTYKYIKL